MRFAIVLFALPFLDRAPAHVQHRGRDLRHSDLGAERDFEFGAVWVLCRVLRMQDFGKMMVWAVVGMRVAAGMYCLDMRSGVRRSPWEVQELLRPRDYAYETCLRLRSVVGSL